MSAVVGAVVGAALVYGLAGAYFFKGFYADTGCVKCAAGRAATWPYWAYKAVVGDE